MSRRGLIIRLLIFVPLFAYFGYGAYQKWRAEQAEEAPPTSHKMQLPDGRTIDVIELTPEQAEKQYGLKLPVEPTVSDANKPAPMTKGEPAKLEPMKLEPMKGEPTFEPVKGESATGEPTKGEPAKQPKLDSPAPGPAPAN